MQIYKKMCLQYRELFLYGLYLWSSFLFGDDYPLITRVYSFIAYRSYSHVLEESQILYMSV